MTDLIINYHLLEHAKNLGAPFYANEFAAGADLKAAIGDNKICLKPLARILVPTGIILTIPQGYEGQIRPRSGLAFKHGLSLVNSPGTIDSDYRGEIKILLINFGQQDFIIEHGMRIAQIIFSKAPQAKFSLNDNINATKRGDKGFGSTGIK